MAIYRRTLEKLLWVIAIALITIMFVTTWIGLEHGAYKMNPIMWAVFRALYKLTGSWAVAVLPFLPLTCLWLYFAVRVGKWLCWKIEKEYPYAERSVLIAFILLMLPNTFYQLGVIKMSYKAILESGLILMMVYLIFEEFRWRREKKRGK